MGFGSRVDFSTPGVGDGKKALGRGHRRQTSLAKFGALQYILERDTSPLSHGNVVYNQLRNYDLSL